MLKNLLVIFLLCFSPAFASVYTVSPNGSGAANGSDWDNCLSWSTFTPERGDGTNIYYLMEGNYAAKTLSVAADGTKVITIKKCVSTDAVCTAIGGYEASEHDGQAVWNPTSSTPLTISTSYWNLDGATGSGSSGSSYGFKINAPTSLTPGSGTPTINLIYMGTSVVNGISIQYFYMEHLTQNYIYHSPTDPVYDMVVAYNYMNGACNGMTIRQWNDSTINHNYFSNNYSVSGVCNGESVSASSCYDCVFSHNTLDNACNGTGCVALAKSAGGVSERWKVYNNVAFGLTWLGITCDSGSTCNDTTVYNNTFHYLTDARAGVKLGSATTGAIAYNNIFFGPYYASLLYEGSITRNHNAYSGSNVGGDGANTIWNISDPFTDSVNHDYSLVAGAAVIDNGATLESPYNVDILGVSRPQGEGFDIGAYEYGAGASTLTIPAGVVIGGGGDGGGVWSTMQ